MNLVKPKKPQVPTKPSEDNKIHLYKNLFFIQRNGDYEPEENFSSLIQAPKEDMEDDDSAMVNFTTPKSVSLKYSLEELAYQYNSWSDGWNMTFLRILSMDERMECYSKDLVQYNADLTKYEKDLKKYFDDYKVLEDEEIKNKETLKQEQIKKLEEELLKLKG